jgi:hypothetical protein
MTAPSPSLYPILATASLFGLQKDLTLTDLTRTMSGPHLPIRFGGAKIDGLHGGNTATGKNFRVAGDRRFCFALVFAFRSDRSMPKI